MARADLILKLVGAGARGDQALFQQTTEALAAEERAKNHILLANRLMERLQSGNNGHVKNSAPAFRQPLESKVLAELIPTRQLEELILPSVAEQAIRELVEEQRRADLLRSYGLEPRNRVLLAGAPGNGKTTLAEALAFELNVPMMLVRYEALIGSFLGETTRRIHEAFDYVRSRHCVLFFDEFDVVGKERGDTHETGEIKRVVSSLLLQVDALPSYVVIVVASNHPELLDRAVWRRFQIRAELPMPTAREIVLWFERFEKRTGHSLGVQEKDLLRIFKGMSFAEMHNFGSDVLRRIALSQPCSNIHEVVAGCLRQLKARYTTANSIARRAK